PLRQSIVIAKRVRHENPAREYFQGDWPGPVSFEKITGLNSRHEKIYSVGFEWPPTTGPNRKCPAKISSNLGTEKISRSARITAGLKPREAARVFSNVPPGGKGRKPSQRTGSKSALVFLRGGDAEFVAVAVGITLS